MIRESIKMIFQLTCIAFVVMIICPGVHSYCDCPVNYRPVGCRKDTVYNRALPELVLYERPKLIHWLTWKTHLPDLVCRCAAIAKQLGYSYFGVQFYGECWSGPSPNAELEFQKHGEGDDCIDNKFKKCTASLRQCTGGNNHNFIYRVEPLYDCEVRFERMGCYSDRRNNRALPEQILNWRSSITWHDYSGFQRSLSCECAKKVLQKGYNTFGVQFYGECWSGPEVDVDYHMHGEARGCINTCYGQCKHFNTFCIGTNHENFIFRISTDKCEIPRTSLGCFNEDKQDRALRVLIKNDVDSKSPAFHGIFRTDYDSWQRYMEGLVCRCARRSKEKGYTHFGITNGGECWGGPGSEATYSKHGESNECYYDNTTPCTSNELCAGGKDTIYVYHI